MVTDIEPLIHLPRLDDRGNPTEYALCDAADGTCPDGLLASSTWQANCPRCEQWTEDGGQPDWGEEGSEA